MTQTRRSPGHARAGGSILHRGTQSKSRRDESRNDARAERRERRDCDNRDQHSSVDRHGVEERRAFRRHGFQASQGACGNRRAQCGACTGQHEALGHQLLDQPAAARAQRQPDRQLARPGLPANQREIGDVRADDQQHAEHGAEQHEQSAPDFGPDHGLA
jgi:hypothetical protein